MAHLFPFIVLLIVITARMISNASKMPGGSQPGPGDLRPTVPEETEQQRRRRFLEAAGLPTGAEPPPPVRPRTAVPHGPLPTVRPPPLMPPATPGRLRRGSPAPAGRSLPQAPPPIRPIGPMGPIGPLAPVIQTATARAGSQLRENIPLPDPTPPPQTAAPAAAAPAGSLLARLRNPASIREAIILREVLGPPRAFQAAGVLSVPR